jgi:hypothetical protein
MKVKKNDQTAKWYLLEKSSFFKKCVFFGILVISTCLLPNFALAEREKIVLDFDDSYYHAGKGKTATLLLKHELRRQYPRLKVKNFKLRKVVLVAKSKWGHGTAQLLVGNNASHPERINGFPAQYHDNRGYSFDRVPFHNPSRASDGRWQIALQGNLVVRKVILVLDDHDYRFTNRMYSWDWHSQRGKRMHRW